MDAAKLQTKINRGYGKVARYLGVTTSVYRPDGSTDPIDPSNLIATLLVRFDTSPDFTARKPPKQGDPRFYAAFDCSGTQAGDYLVADDRTFFITWQEGILPTSVVCCNATVSIHRPSAGSPQPGARYYGGNVSGRGVQLLAGWPAAITLNTGRGDGSASKLPADARQATYRALLPVSAGVTLLPSDVVEDQNNHRYLIVGAELTALGYQINLESALS